MRGRHKEFRGAARVAIVRLRSSACSTNVQGAASTEVSRFSPAVHEPPGAPGRQPTPFRNQCLASPCFGRALPFMKPFAQGNESAPAWRSLRTMPARRRRPARSR